MSRAMRASGLLFALNAGVAWLIAAPLSEVVATIARRHPDGDSALIFAPGGTFLLDWMVRLADVGPALVRSGSLLLLAWFVASIGVEGGALAMLDVGDGGDATAGRAVGRGLGAFWRLAALTGVSLLLQALLLSFGAVAASRMGARWPDLPARAFAVGLVAAAPFVAAAAWVRAAGELARAAVIHADSGALDALRGPFEVGSEVTRLLVRSVPRWIASVGALGYAAAFSSWSDRVALVFAVHALVTLLQVRLRVSTLTLALEGARAVEAQLAEPEGT